MRYLCSIKYSLIPIALVFPVFLRAQTSSTPTFTTINLNNTVLQSPVKRLGMNLGAANFYDSGQMLKNLIVSNPGFEGEIAQTMVLCSAGTATSCTDSISYSGWPADYWNGATYTVIYGTALGRKGTISTSTSGSGQPAVFNFADSGTSPSSGDYMIVNKAMPGNAVEGWAYTLGGNGAVSTNMTDLPPDTLGTQSLVMTAPAAGDSATITYYFDSTSNHTFLQLNGGYTLSFKAKTTNASGSGSLYVSLQRLSNQIANPYVYNSAIPLTNQWQTFNIPFTASEDGTVVGSVRLVFGTSVAGQALSANQIYLDDASLVQTNTDPTNTTVFRDPVVNTLKELNPGVVRFWFNQLGETLDNLLAPQLARQRSQYQYVDVNYISYGLGEFLQLMQTVGSGSNASSSPPEPWIVLPMTLSDAEASNVIDYLAGPTTTVYGKKRADAGQSKPWTTVFPKIHLEFSDEAWNNGLYGGNMTNQQAYGTRAQNVFAIMRNNANYNAASFDLMINGYAFTPYAEGVIQSYCDNNDSLAAQPYMMLTVNDPFNGTGGTLQSSAAAIETLFGSTFAEAEAFVTPTGTAEGISNGLVLQSIAAAQSSGRPVQFAVTETNIDPFNGGSITQPELDSYTTSIGAGLGLIDSMLQNMRVGVLTQNIFELPGYNYFPYGGKSLFLYGSVVDMGVTNVKRPQFLAAEVANNAIGTNTTMLQTVHTGLDPTWNQPYANSVQLNNAHYLQSFGFNNGANYSLILINTNRSASEQVNFSGANVPGGTVQMTVLTSANITDTNEASSVVAPVSSTLSNFNAAAGLTLPPFSMTTLTWTAPAISNVTVTAVTGTSATISWTTDSTSTSVVNYGTTPAYGTQSATMPAGSATQSVTLTGLSAGTNYNFAIMATNGAGATSSSANFTFGTMASFTVSAPTSISLAQGQSGIVPVIVSDTNGYTGPVNLSLTGLPAGATSTFQATSGGAELVLTVPSTVLAASYPLTITGTAGSTVVTAPLSLIVSGASQSQTITFNSIGNQYIGAAVTAVATASSGGTVTFSVVNNGNCSSSGTNGSTIKFLAAGNCGIIASQAGNSVYEPVSQGQIVVINSPLPPQTITFNSIADQTVGATLNLSATASSGLAVSFTSSTPNTCSVTGTTASFLAIGTCTIVASQGGNNSFAAAPNVPQSINVKGAVQTITFPTIATQTAGNSITLGATASSGLSVSYSSTTPSVCSVIGTTLTLNTAGNCTVTASQAGNSAYAVATSVSQTFQVNAAPLAQTITFPTIAAQNVGTPLALNAAASSGLTVSFASTTPAVCTVSSTTASFGAMGTCTITASQAGNSSYLAATSVTQSFTVNAALKPQTITFNQIAAQYIGTPLSLAGTATASSGLTVSFASNTPNICTVSGTSAQFILAGTCSISASQGGNGTYAAATPITQTFTVNPTAYTQTITFSAIATQTAGTPLALTATATSNLAVSYASNTPSVCTVSGTTATFVGAGTCSITASQTGNSSYQAATPVTQSFMVNAGPQTITFGAIAAQTVGTPLTLAATASSGLAVGYASTTTSVCTVSGTTATFIAPGTCSITASQAGNSSYATATPVTQNITVNAALQSQTITFGAIATQTVGTPLTLTATASSKLGVSYTSSSTGVCTVSGSTATFVAPGTCTITASQSGNTTYSAATPVSQSFTVNAAPKSQSISFGSISAQQVGTPLTLNASASSGLAVSFVSNSTPVCTVSNATATFVTSGTCSITASQAGNSAYAAATSVTQSFTVNGQGQIITFNPIPTQQAGTSLTLSATASSGLAISYTSNDSSVCSVSGSTATLTAGGTCSITASQAGNATFAAATAVSQSFTVQSGGTAGSTTTVSLGSAANVYGFFNNGTSITNGGLDTSSYAYSVSLLGASLTFQAIPYTFATPGSANTASSTTITLPAGSYSALNFLGTAIYGNQTSQTFTVNYTDGTASKFTQSMSDWGAPQSYTGETIASTMAYRLSPNGSRDTASQSAGSSWYLYAYSFPLNRAKTVQSFTLPNIRNVTVLAVTLSTSQAAQTINFGTIAAQTVGRTLTLSATASSGLAVSYASSTSSVCTVSGSTATFVGSGNCTITASQAGSSSYAAATPVSQSFSVNAAALKPQTITFNAIPSQIVGGTLTVSATASSGLPVTFTVVPNGNCSISGNVVTFLNAGNCGVVANQAGNSANAAAPAVGQIIVVNNPTPQTVTFGTIAGQTVGTPLALTASASSGLAVSYASSTSTVCTVSGSTATFSTAGTCTITALQAGNNVYSAATPVSQSFTVNNTALKSQTITFSTIAAQAVGTPLALTATASSGLAVTFASSTATICAVSGSGATFLAPGTCTITASQAGNSSYAAATSVSQSFTVSAAALKSQTITFNAIPPQTVASTLTVSATASSGLPVTFTVVPNGNCSVSGDVVTFLNPGNCGVVASQAGNGAYAPAPTVGQIVVVTNPNPQTITFGTIATQTVGTPLTLTATASSGLAVSYASSTSTICTVSGSTATFLAAGTCAITASQPGNSTYSAATSVLQSFQVNAATLKSQTITFNPIAAQTVGQRLTVSATANSGLPVSFVIVPNGNCSISGNVVTFLNQGSCGVIATQAGNGTFAAAPAVGQVIAVN